MEALRELRINHRGNYRQLLEEMLCSYRLVKMQGEESAAGSTQSSSSGDSVETEAVPGNQTHTPADKPSEV